MKKFTKILEQAPLKGFVQSCLSLTAVTVLGFIAVEPVRAASLHTGFASYAITDLGEGNANGINNLGQVVVGQKGVGWIWDNGQLTEVKDSTWAYQINNSGQVVGRYLSENWTDNAYVWENGKRTDLGYFGGISSLASDINESGQIVGRFVVSQEKWFPFLWKDGKMINLGTLGYDAAAAQGINNRGQIVGYSGLALHITHAFQWENGQMIDLGTLPGFNGSTAYDINDAGQAIGYSWNTITKESHATLWSNGQITDLGTLGGNISAAVAINNKGQVAGFGNTTGNGGFNHGFIWEDGTMADVNSLIAADSGWFLQQINGINDRGQMVGQGINSATGKQHGFLLNPICGSSQRNPLLPDNFEDGWHSFSNVANRLWFDPPTSAGFTFKIGDDVANGGGGTGDGCIVEQSPIALNPQPTEPSLFTKILGLPSGIDADELFSVLVGGKEIGKFKPNEVVDFVALLGYGVSEFRVAGIDAAIDPKNPLAFPIKLESNRDKFSFKMRADAAEAVPEPSEIAGLATSAAFLAGLVLKRKRKLVLLDTRVIK